MKAEPMLRIAENRAEYGSFKDSMRAPIHRWFSYPAGFSYRLVESKLKEYGLGTDSYVLDPFAGCGTTSVVAKHQGVNSIGIEAHPFVHWVARTKLHSDYDLDKLSAVLEEIVLRTQFSSFDQLSSRIEDGAFPQLVRKCFSHLNLMKLLALRDLILEMEVAPEVQDFLKLALTSTLRVVSSAGTGWPYIAPSKYHSKSQERDAFSKFHAQVLRMIDDVAQIRASEQRNSASHVLLLGDARVHHPEIRPGTIDLIVTSPPYLNNYDYADRTRLEMYFWRLASTWRDITRQVRQKLVMAATTQVTRRTESGNGLINSDLETIAPGLALKLRAKVTELAEARLHKGGKKSYDVMVAGYFNDMFRVIQQMYIALRDGCDFILVLGDSAPYSVYIPTDLWIGDLALAVGFRSYQVELLRTRGGKWAGNPQRHKVGLRESILTITK